jgi:hypothetical protein
MKLGSKVLSAAAGAFLVGSIAAPASATISLLLSRQDLVARSGFVARVRVGKATYGESADGSTLITRTEVRIAKCLKGSCPDSVEVEQFGGHYKGKNQRVLGDGELRPGEDAIAFFKAGEKGTAYLTVLAQSVYHVDANGLARRDLDGLSLVERREGKLVPIDPGVEAPIPAEALEADVIRIAKEK